MGSMLMVFCWIFCRAWAMRVEVHAGSGHDDLTALGDLAHVACCRSSLLPIKPVADHADPSRLSFPLWPSLSSPLRARIPLPSDHSLPRRPRRALRPLIACPEDQRCTAERPQPDPIPDVGHGDTLCGGLRRAGRGEAGILLFALGKQTGRARSLDRHLQCPHWWLNR